MIERLRKRARSFAISAILAWSTIAFAGAINAYSNREITVFHRASLETAYRESRTEDVRAWNEVIEQDGFVFAMYIFVSLLASVNAIASARGLSRLSTSSIALETRRLETDVT